MNQDSPGPVIDAPPAHAGVIWISGYSAAGNISVGRKLEFKLRADGLRS